MRCSICGIRIDSVEEAAEQGWTPYFFDLDQEYELACPACSEALLKLGEDGEMEGKEEYRGKLRYLAKRTPEPPQEHLAIGIAIPRKRTRKTQLKFPLATVFTTKMLTC